MVHFESRPGDPPRLLAAKVASLAVFHPGRIDVWRLVAGGCCHTRLSCTSVTMRPFMDP